jgi:hypothetical protein
VARGNGTIFVFNTDVVSYSVNLHSLSPSLFCRLSELVKIRATVVENKGVGGGGARQVPNKENCSTADCGSLGCSRHARLSFLISQKPTSGPASLRVRTRGISSGYARDSGGIPS